MDVAIESDVDDFEFVEDTEINAEGADIDIVYTSPTEVRSLEGASKTYRHRTNADTSMRNLAAPNTAAYFARRSSASSATVLCPPAASATTLLSATSPWRPWSARRTTLSST